MFVSNQLLNQVRKEVEELINEPSLKTEISIKYFTQTTCDYCGGIDDTYGESINPQCSTCGGLGYYKEYITHIVNCVFNQFLNKGSFNYINTPINMIPDTQVRITCLLDDVVVRTGSASAPTYFDTCDYVQVYDKHYNVKSTKRFGLKEPFLVTVVLDEKG